MTTAITSIAVVYQPRYNGVSIIINDELGIEEVGRENEKLFEKVTDTIVDHLFADCDEDGYFNGSTCVAKEYILETVSKAFPNVPTVVEFGKDS